MNSRKSSTTGRIASPERLDHLVDVLISTCGLLSPVVSVVPLPSQRNGYPFYEITRVWYSCRYI